MKTIIIFLTLISLIVLLNACTVKSGKVNTKKTESMTKRLEKNIRNETNFLFFNENESSKIITLYFYDNYNDEPITSIKLFNNDQLVSNHTSTIDTTIHDNGIFTFELNSYVPFFNSIELGNHNGKLLKLYTGDYYFELVNIQNEIDEGHRWQLESFATSEGNDKFAINALFNRDSDQFNKFEIMTAVKKFKDISLNESFKFKENKRKLAFTYMSSRISKKVVSYEVIVVQTNNLNQRYIMNSIIVPLNE